MGASRDAQQFGLFSSAEGVTGFTCHVCPPIQGAVGRDAGRGAGPNAAMQRLVTGWQLLGLAALPAVLVTRQGRVPMATFLRPNAGKLVLPAPASRAF